MPAPVNVIFAIPTLLTGGAEKFVMELAVRLDPIRFHSTVLVTRGRVDAASLQHLERAGVEVVVVGRQSWISSIFICARVLLRRKPQVIHTNIGSIFHVSLGVFLLKRSIIRIHTLHNIAGYAEPGSRLLIIKNIINLMKFQLVSISHAVRESASKAFALPLEQIPLIPNGVDIHRFAPGEKNEKKTDSEIRFVAVGSLSPVKAHAALILAFERMEISIRDRCSLTIAGGGPLYAELADLIRSLNLQDRVALLGNRQDVSPILEASDVFVSASLTEGFPLSLLEAMATGLPAVVTAVGGVGDIVRDGVEGILIEPQNTAMLTRSMEKLARDVGLQLEFGQNARRRAESFTWDRCVASYSSLYAGS
ncbi:glycosyltransferase [Paeniglutamicibacter sp. ZC-3]|uniref:glycosyltransferase n=1 Tax=Paeniglutamicibacter sp. ZC-3 TaxID=2986919 RepID=UPI0021F71F7F|nr:glycosyltransferase [Paeniglutamicibacter sp. ZC-3]MCV9996508.1 glycosyltransferase [Paeniglutamicibacter sp. ZC-3]